MKTILNSVFLVLLLGLTSCEKEGIKKLLLDSINTEKYYSEEIIPADYQKLYGKWSFYKVSGGFDGSGHKPNYDYLEIKNIGIYGLIRNDSLLEYGKIELHTFDHNTQDGLQIKFVTDYYIGQYSFIDPPEKYIRMYGMDSLVLVSPCCDRYNYYYKRVK